MLSIDFSDYRLHDTWASQVAVQSVVVPSCGPVEDGRQFSAATKNVIQCWRQRLRSGPPDVGQ